jgi:RimJ/RimL family protein N-acetyltransferase
MKGSLPIPTKEGEPKTYRAVYAVHELLSGPSHPSTPIPDLKTVEKRFIGLILLHALGPNDLALPDHMFPPSSLAPECLTIQIGYLFLPGGWGKGYATESVKAVFEACKKETAFWAPYEKVYIRVVVNAENPASQRVVVKTGMEELGVYVWSGERIWIAGKWRTTDRLYISGKFLKE